MCIMYIYILCMHVYIIIYILSVYIYMYIINIYIYDIYTYICIYIIRIGSIAKSHVQKFSKHIFGAFWNSGLVPGSQSKHVLSPGRGW